MKINIIGNLAEVYTPYNSDFVRRIKNIGGTRWDGKRKCWTIPAESIDACREIMKIVYGCCDLEENVKTVKLRLTFSDDISECCGDVVLFAKTLCHAYGRDSGGRAGDDVAYIKGEPKSGGSAKNWRSIVPGGSVVILSNVAETLLHAFDSASVPGLTVEVVTEAPNRELLLAEREKLVKRIAEIDSLIAYTTQ